MWWERLGTQFEHLLLQITIQCNWISMQLSKAYRESLPKLHREVCKLCFWIRVPWPLFGVYVPLLKPRSQNEEAVSRSNFTILWTFYRWVYTLLFIGTKQWKHTILWIHLQKAVLSSVAQTSATIQTDHSTDSGHHRQGCGMEGCSNPFVGFTCICWPDRTFKSHLKRL